MRALSAYAIPACSVQNQRPHMLNILLETPNLLAIDKPSGLLVHRGMAADKVTLVDLVAEYLQSKTTYPMHRLDRGTSGVILFAKDSETARVLQTQFTEHTIQRTYIALVRGAFTESKVLDHPVPKGEGKERVPATTSFEPIEVLPATPRTLSLVQAQPKTGRFHQIRRHLKHLNHPIIGDANYGKGALNREIASAYGIERLALHAAELVFQDPDSGSEIKVLSPIPLDLAQGFERLRASTTDNAS